MTDEPTQIQTESATYTTADATADLAKLTETIIKNVPNIVPELIKGNTTKELIDSIEQSRAVFERYFPSGVAATPTTKPATEPAATTAVVTPPAVPAGGQPFTDDISKLPPMELIKRGMAQVRAKAS